MFFDTPSDPALGTVSGPARSDDLEIVAVCSKLRGQSVANWLAARAWRQSGSRRVVVESAEAAAIAATSGELRAQFLTEFHSQGFTAVAVVSSLLVPARSAASVSVAGSSWAASLWSQIEAYSALAIDFAGADLVLELPSLSSGAVPDDDKDGSARLAEAIDFIAARLRVLSLRLGVRVVADGLQDGALRTALLTITSREIFFELDLAGSLGAPPPNSLAPPSNTAALDPATFNSINLGVAVFGARLLSLRLPHSQLEQSVSHWRKQAEHFAVIAARGTDQGSDRWSPPPRRRIVVVG